jgi:CRISPR-associated endonuclease/helicase Cas3
VNATLVVEDFIGFFEEVYGHAPFAWQVRLARDLCGGVEPPSTLALPTGTGKTALIDIAVFHLAHDLSRGTKRCAPMRIAWVVDRRLIVDEAFDRARNLADCLSGATGGILKRVADALRSVSCTEGLPLVANRLRGGIPREGDWARTPVQPTVIASTVDQVGSRLLFRGYGVSPRMRPIHAGLLGEDALIVLDEVHLSGPFRTTLKSVEKLRGPSSAPWRFVQLSATPRHAAGRVFSLTADDLADDVLRRRVATPKAAGMANAGRLVAGSSEHAAFFVKHALDHATFEGGEIKNIAVVVNRVDLARLVFEGLRAEIVTRKLGASAVLLVGRGRDIEKDVLCEAIVERCKSDPSGQRPPPSDVQFVVATQCIEAGADLDFDAMVTQLAALDALRQRFGRVNRMGRAIDAKITIVATHEEVAARADDPIYGTAARATWEFLCDRLDDAGTIDVSADGFTISDEEAASLASPTRQAPVLMPAHVAQLARTMPAPFASPNPSLYLHGSPDSLAEVSVVWRADLPTNPTGDSAVVARLLTIAPPRSSEAVSLPFFAARRWMAGKETQEVSDVNVDADDTGDERKARIVAWRWDGGDAKLVRARDIRPGDTLVVASEVGGCDRYGWNPGGGAVPDIADNAFARSSDRRRILRIHPALLRQRYALAVQNEDQSGDGAWNPIGWKQIGDALELASADSSRGENVARLLTEADVLPEFWRTELEAILLELAERHGRLEIYFPYGSNDESDEPQAGAAFIATYRARRPASDVLPESATETDAIGIEGREHQSLVEHSGEVRSYALRFAERAGFAPGLAADVALAAFLHDVGKADVRFQRYLSGERWLPSREILAKSGRRPPAAERFARTMSRLPEGWRHEALSVRIARSHPDFAKANDPELVLWLIGTHHGFGRPFFEGHTDPLDGAEGTYRGFHPFEDSPMSVPAGVGAQHPAFSVEVPTPDGVLLVDWQTMFERLETRYGPWGLANLEAVVRLADHRASEAIEPAAGAKR